MLKVPCREMFILFLFIILFIFYLNKLIKISGIILIISFAFLGVTLTRIAVTPTSMYGQIGEEVTFTGIIKKIEDKGEYFRVFVKGQENVLITAENVDCIVGDEVQVTCRLKAFERPVNHGEFDNEWYYKTQNIWVRGTGQIQVVKPANTYFKFLDNFKKHFLQNIDNIATEDTKGILKSVIMGDKSCLDQEISQDFQENGIAHILAISGLHLSIIGMTLYRLLRKIGLRFFICALVSGAVLVSYGIMTGNSISTVRALIMFIISVNAQVTGRRYDIITGASLAALLLLLQYPLYITSGGFLLSFGAVSGIVFVARPLSGIFPENAGKFIKIPGKAFIASLGVTIVTMPVLGCFFYQVSPYAVFLNIIVVPLMAVVMAGGILGGLAAMISKTVGMMFVGPACYVLKLYIYICDVVEKWPGHVVVTGCPQPFNVVIYVLVIIIIYVIVIKSKKSYLNILVSVMATTAAILVLFSKKENDMAIHMLAVGQGQCILIENSGKFAMVDCGSSDVANVAATRVIPCLKYYGVSRLECLFITHSDSDHCNGVDALLDKINVKEIYGGGLAGFNEGVVSLTAGMTINWGDVIITVYNPSPDRKYNDENAASLVLLLEKGNFSMLFTGDIDESIEKKIMKSMLLKKNITVLQVPHHGSKNSSGQEFIEILRPDVSIISCGLNNFYGHPHSETINRLKSIGTKIYRTDTGGEISIFPSEHMVRCFLFAFFGE